MKFLRRVVKDGRQYILANDDYPNDYNKFSFDSASLLPAKFEIMDVKFPPSSSLKEVVPKAPAFILKQTWTNGGDAAETSEHTFAFEKTVEESSTTNWEQSFGMGMSFGFSASLPLGMEMSVGIDLNYDSKTGGEATRTTTRKVSQSTTVNVPPRTRATGVYKVWTTRNKPIDFVATIKKTWIDSVGRERETLLTEKGTWEGSVVWDTRIDVVTNHI